MRLRKTIATLGLTTALALSLGATGASAQDLTGQTMVFGGFGGDLQANQDIAWLQPFAAATGVTINQTDSPDMATLATQQEAGNVLLDVIQIESSTVDANCGTVFMEVQIDRAELNTALDTNSCGVPVIKFSYVLAYNAATYPDGPTSVADFFDTEQFPGIRAIRAGSNVGIIETALQADGVAPADMYPVDLDKAVAKIETIKDSIEVKESFAVIQDGLANGEFDMALVPNGRAFNAWKTNPDIKVVFVGAVTLYDNLAIPTGAKNPEAATAFLQYVALHSTQTALTELFPYGMGTVGDAPNLDDQAKGFFPDSYADQLLMQDAGWWGANDAAVTDRLTALFAQ
jgi:putative spermidine/putrescine transport system substrate-binding protein